MASYTQATLGYQTAQQTLSASTTASTQETLTWVYDATGTGLIHTSRTDAETTLTWAYGITDTARTHFPASTAQAGDGTPAFSVDFGVKIPTGSFRAVEVTIQNREGEPLTDLEWVLPAEKFPVAVPVGADATATLRLLEGQEYDRFQAIAPNPDGDTDFVWYETTGATIELHEQEQTLTFSEEPIAGGGGGLLVAEGVSLG